MEDMFQLVHTKIAELNLQLYEKHSRFELELSEDNNDEHHKLNFYKKQGNKETVQTVWTGHIAEIMVGLYVFDAQINPEDKIVH